MRYKRNGALQVETIGVSICQLYRSVSVSFYRRPLDTIIHASLDAVLPRLGRWAGGEFHGLSGRLQHLARFCKTG
jgi:hypothetical protein